MTAARAVSKDHTGWAGDSRELYDRLRGRVGGEVRFDAGSRALYSTDASNYRQAPIGVVIPRTVDDVLAAVETCREHGAPVLSRGGGTSLAGQTCNVAVVLDFSKYMNRVLEVDPDRKLARVQPGTILDVLRAATVPHDLTFAPDPATHSRCTLGGMIGNNACGVHSVMAGKTDANVEDLDILTYGGVRMRVGRTGEAEGRRKAAAGGQEGRIYGRLLGLRDRYQDAIRTGFPHIPRRVSGYNLPDLLPEHGFNVAGSLVGSEGTLVTILEATVNLVHWPPYRALAVLAFPDIYQACDRVPELITFGPIGLEGFDHHLVDDMRSKRLNTGDLRLLPAGGGWLLAEFGGETPHEAEEKARNLARTFARSDVAVAVYTDEADQKRLWAIRESALGATALVPGEGVFWPGWEDSAVPPDRLGAYLRDLHALLDRYGFHDITLYGHFGQGCTHLRINFDLMSARGISTFTSFMGEAADLCVSYGGSLSGEHGDGQARSELWPRMFGPELMQAFAEFKGIWDPDDGMNPGKLVRPYRMDQNLRLGTDYNPPALRTHFRFPDDGGSFAAATRRCVGVGKCRRLDGGTMCPSFMVTREEEHSTRGRARLLFEMLDGRALEGGWRNQDVKDALDLCLACKGCRGDCPVRVDMATYKAEFLSHYYARRLRPASAYSMGLIHRWARLAAIAPQWANFFSHTPGLSTVTKLAGGVSLQRSLPRFANQTFRSWFQERGPSQGQGEKVILWTDTFNNHFYPDVLVAAVDVLEAAGFSVVIPTRDLCCGRPLYDYGFLGMARRLLESILTALAGEIEAGLPVVVLEPSCAAVFRDELVAMLPQAQNARRLSKQTFLLSEFLQQRAPDLPLRTLEGQALVQIHCHHRAIFGPAAEEAILGRLGLTVMQPEPGCCGMAGAFGFEREHRDISVEIGERHLLPAVRNAAAGTLLIADGFSCREQIAQETGRSAVHLSQVVRSALPIAR